MIRLACGYIRDRLAQNNPGNFLPREYTVHWSRRPHSTPVLLAPSAQGLERRSLREGPSTHIPGMSVILGYRGYPGRFSTT